MMEFQLFLKRKINKHKLRPKIFIVNYGFWFNIYYMPTIIVKKELGSVYSITFNAHIHAPDVFKKTSEAFFIMSDLCRSLPTSHGNCRSPLDPCNLKVTVTLLFGVGDRYFYIGVSLVDLGHIG